MEQNIFQKEECMKNYLTENDSRILSLIRGKDYVSGETIARELSVSRNAVFKSIGRLKEKGYNISSVSNRGYRLLNETNLSEDLIREYLRTDIHDLYVLHDTDSTNEELRRLISEKGNSVSEGTTVCSDLQTRGKGRRGRSFSSPDGTGLYMSFVIKPRMNADEAVRVTAYAAVAVRRAIIKLTGEDCGIKWVNDLYLRGKKVCGILTESSYNLETNEFDHVIVGIGVNLYTPEHGFGDLCDIAGGILPYSDDTADNKSRLAAYILNEFFSGYSSDEIPDVTQEYRQNCIVTGKHVDVISQKDRKRAYVTGVDDQYRLQVRYEDGSDDILNSGEISLVLEQ